MNPTYVPKGKVGNPVFLCQRGQPMSLHPTALPAVRVRLRRLELLWHFQTQPSPACRMSTAIKLEPGKASRSEADLCDATYAKFEVEMKLASASEAECAEPFHRALRKQTVHLGISS